MTTDSVLRLAGCVIRNTKGELLLLHRNKKGVQQWELPGGKVEKDETAEDTARREILEELGVEIVLGSYLGEASFMTNDMRCLYMWYEAQIAAAKAPYIAEPDSFDELRYWDIDLLKEREDLSANLQNLLGSTAIK